MTQEKSCKDRKKKDKEGFWREQTKKNEKKVCCENKKTKQNIEEDNKRRKRVLFGSKSSVSSIV